MFIDIILIVNVEFTVGKPRKLVRKNPVWMYVVVVEWAQGFCKRGLADTVKIFPSLVF